MAILNYSQEEDPRIEVDTKTYAIGGQLVTVKLLLNETEKAMLRNEDQYKEEIRKRITTELVDQILRNRLCEITTKYDPAWNNQVVIVRAYLAPDDQIKILRTQKI